LKPTNPLKKANSTLQIEKFDRNKYLDREDAVVAPPKPRTEPKPAPGTDTTEKVDPSKSNPLGSTVGRKTDPKDTTTTGPSDGRAAPPPGYRKAAPEFTRIRAQPENEKKDPK